MTKSSDERLAAYYRKQLGYVENRLKADNYNKAKKEKWQDKNWLFHQRVWRHNGFLGWVVLMSKNLRQIIEAETTSVETKLLADRINNLLQELRQSLKTRIDR